MAKLIIEYDTESGNLEITECSVYDAFKCATAIVANAAPAMPGANLYAKGQRAKAHFDRIFEGVLAKMEGAPEPERNE